MYTVSKAKAAAATRSFPGSEQFHAVVEFMYGDKQRTQLTLAFAMLCVILSKILLSANQAALHACPV